jgi:hypothetical protein
VYEEGVVGVRKQIFEVRLEAKGLSVTAISSV